MKYIFTTLIIIFNVITWSFDAFEDRFVDRDNLFPETDILAPACDTTRFFYDADGDGLGDIDSIFRGCAAPANFVSNPNDCDDNDATNANCITYIVNTTDDTDDGVCDAVHCSYREAMTLSNNNPKDIAIHFSLPVGMDTITLSNDINLTNSSIKIDGSTNPLYDEGREVVINTNPAFQTTQCAGCRNVSIFGLTFYSDENRQLSIGIDASNIQIGKENNGNKFLKFSAISIQNYSTLNIQHNYFGAEEKWLNTGELQDYFNFDINTQSNLSFILEKNTFQNSDFYVQNSPINPKYLLLENNFICSKFTAAPAFYPNIAGASLHRARVFADGGDSLLVLNLGPQELGFNFTYCYNSESPIVGRAKVQLHGLTDIEITGDVNFGDVLSVMTVDENGYWSGNLSDGLSNAFKVEQYVVNTTDNVYDGICDAMHCSLEDALNSAANNADTSYIHFNIPNEDPIVFKDQTSGINNTEPGSYIYLDATSQPGYYQGRIVFDNSSLGVGWNSEVKGIHFTNSTGYSLLPISIDSFYHLTQNTFECNPDKPLYFNFETIDSPVFDSIVNNKIYGTSIPDAKIELFESENKACDGYFCQASKYLGETYSDSNGNWTFNININDINWLTATAYDGKRTSDFSNCYRSEPFYYYVNVEDDTDDGECNDLHCSLREALNKAIESRFTSYIYFKFDARPPFEININSQIDLASLNPDVAYPIIIDGTSNFYYQPGDVTINLNTADFSTDQQPIEIYGVNWSLQDVSSLLLDGGGIASDQNGEFQIDRLDIIGDSLRPNTFNSNGQGFVGWDGIVQFNTFKGVNIITQQYSIFKQNDVDDSSTFKYVNGSGRAINIDKNNFNATCRINIQNSPSTQSFISSPIIDNYNNYILSGTADPNVKIEIHKSAISCSDPSCESTYVNTTYSNSNGDWSIQFIPDSNDPVYLLALANSNSGHLSNFSDCYLIDNYITYVVNTTDINDDGMCNTSHCSIYEAINASNNDGIPSYIHFDLPSPVIPNINLNVPLVFIEDHTYMDGSLQNNNDSLVSFNGSQHNVNTSSLVWTDHIGIKGLIIKNFIEHGITVGQGASNIEIGDSLKSNFLYGNGSSAIFINENAEDVYLMGNQIGIDENMNVVSSNQIGIKASGAHSIQISSNVISGNQKAIEISNTQKFEISQNTIECNSGGISEDQNVPRPTILNATEALISGTGIAGSRIEVFNNPNTCNNLCQGEIYLGKTYVNGDGNWYFHLPHSTLITDRISVVQHYNDQTSEMTSCISLESNQIIVNTTDNINDGTCNDSHCSLVEAISVSNIDGVATTIQFDYVKIGNETKITPPGTILIQDDDTVIDGVTGIIDSPIIIDGSAHNNSGIEIQNNNASIIGLQLQNFKQDAITSINNNNILLDRNIIINNDRGINIQSATGVSIYNNLIGSNPNGQEAGNNTGITTSYSTDITLFNNEIKYNNRALIRINNSEEDVSRNALSCNEIPQSNVFQQSLSSIVIQGTNVDTLYGTSNTTSGRVDIFIADQICNDRCQGEILVGETMIDNNGDWHFKLPNSVYANAFVTATVTSNNLTSDYSDCHLLLPDYCEIQLLAPTNLDPCSTVGVVMDMTQLTDSEAPLSSDCAATYAGNDAWYTVTIPQTGNLMVRSNIDNTIVPVIQAYTGDCDGLTPLACEVLDSIPYTMVFEDYTPGNTIYLRVWDKDNTVVTSGNTALLHLTAHELDATPDNWTICDEANGVNNPTTISKKDGNSFILEFDAMANASDIQDANSALTTDGLTLVDECLCNSHPLQLWGADNPIKMEGLKRRARRRANVDTTNYNYIFENIEFQVNSYAIGQQYDTDVAMNEEGDFMMVWVDEQRKHNYGRFYGSSGNPLVPEFRIGTVDKNQSLTRIVYIDNDTFLAVYQQLEENGTQIFARMLTWNGSEVIRGNIIDISALASASSNLASAIKDIAKYGKNPVVSASDNTLFISWTSGSYIFYQLYDSNMNFDGFCSSIGDDVNTAFNSHISSSMNSNNANVMVWEAEDTDGKGIYFQRIASNSSLIGAPSLINNHQVDDQGQPDVVLLDDGSFIATWESYEQEGSGLGYGIFAQRFNSQGQKVGAEFQVNTYTTDDQRESSITAFDDGTFYISWSSYGQDGYLEGIYGQVFAADGTPIDGEFRLNTYTVPEQEKPRTSNNGENLFITAWEDGGNDGSYKGIFAQRYEILTVGGQKKFYPIGTTTPSTLLGEGLPYPSTYYAPTDELSAVRVAIIDTGIDTDHPALVNSFWDNAQPSDGENCHLMDEIGYDFVNEDGVPDDLDGHGTQVAGIISRDFNPDIKLEIMNLKFHERGRGTVFDAICAIYYAVDNGADVINLSWGFEASEEPAILRKALQYASNNDVIIVTTAGNTSKNLDNIAKYPANLNVDNMMVVTSYQLEKITLQKKLSNYACYGANNVDIAAYGFVQTTALGDTLTQAAGTSLAAPFVARTAATIRGLYPMLTASEIKDCILTTAEYDASLDGKVATNGILHHDDAIECAHQKALGCLGIDLHLVLDQSQDELFQTDAYITSESNIQSNTNIQYKASQHIELGPGFCVAPGSIFYADIEDCNPNVNPSLHETEVNLKFKQDFRLQKYSNQTGKIKCQFDTKYAQKIQMALKSSENGTLFDQWDAKIDKSGTFEKILDVSKLTNGQYSIEMQINGAKSSNIINIARR